MKLNCPECKKDEVVYKTDIEGYEYREFEDPDWEEDVEDIELYDGDLIGDKPQRWYQAEHSDSLLWCSKCDKEIKQEILLEHNKRLYLIKNIAGI